MPASTENTNVSPPHSKSDFWKYWTGQTISNLGSSITLFALPLLVYKLTGSALNLGITTATEMLPYLLFGLLLGAWADRVDRKFMMIGTDIARVLNVWEIYAIGFIHSTLTICFESGQFAALSIRTIWWQRMGGFKQAIQPAVSGSLRFHSWPAHCANAGLLAKSL